MKKSVLSIVFILLVSVSGFASQFPNVPVEVVQSLTNENARGEEVKLVRGEYVPVVHIGGWGPYIASWQLRMTVEVDEIAYDKVFRLIQPTSSYSKVYYFNFGSENIRYLGRSAENKGVYELLIQESYTVNPSTPFSLEVLMAPKYNQTAHINMPFTGWYGPTYGFQARGAGYGQ